LFSEAEAEERRKNLVANALSLVDMAVNDDDDNQISTYLPIVERARGGRDKR
jgi:hypothetical protein